MKRKKNENKVKIDTMNIQKKILVYMYRVCLN